MPERDQQEFKNLFADAEQGLYAYIFAMVPRHSESMDILQETALRLWAHFDDFDRTRSFRAWARKFAHTEVLKAYEKGKYRNWMLNAFSEETVVQLAEEFEPHSGVLELRQEALVACLKELNEPQYDLLHNRYWKLSNMREYAEKLGLSEHQIYRRLNKIRILLHECIDARLVDGGS